MRYPLDPKIESLPTIPYTISYVMRKRQQLDGIYELPKEKRPDDELIWDSPAEELERWFNDLSKNRVSTTAEIVFSDSDIER